MLLGCHLGKSVQLHNKKVIFMQRWKYFECKEELVGEGRADVLLYLGEKSEVQFTAAAAPLHSGRGWGGMEAVSP